MTASPNLDLVRSIYAAWERGDLFSSADWADPEIELVLADGPDPGSWTGLSGLVEEARGWMSTVEGVRLVAEEYRELDAERVLVLEHRSGRFKASGLELEPTQTRGAVLFHVHDGKVTKLVAYFDRERALADLSLAPEAESS